MKYSEIARKFKDKWVLFVVKKERLGRILEGDVLISSPNKQEISLFLSSPSAKQHTHLAMLYFGKYKRAVAYANLTV